MIHLMYCNCVCYILLTSYNIINVVFVNGVTIRIKKTNKTLDLSQISIEYSKTDPLSSVLSVDAEKYNVSSSMFEQVSSLEDITDYREAFELKEKTTLPPSPKRVAILALSDCIELCERNRLYHKDGMFPTYKNLLKMEKNMSKGQEYNGWTHQGVKKCIELMLKHGHEIGHVGNCFMENKILRTDVAKAFFLGICRATDMMLKTDKKNMYELNFENVMRKANEIIPEGHSYHKRNRKKMEYCFKALGDQSQYPPEEIAVHFMECLVLQ